MPKLPPVYRNPLLGPGRPARAARKTPKASGDHNRKHSRARGYDRTWERLRRMHLNGHPYCVFHLAQGVVVPAKIVDHVITIDDDPSRRLDPTNLQSLCKPCHDGPKQRLDAKARRAARSLEQARVEADERDQPR